MLFTFQRNWGSHSVAAGSSRGRGAKAEERAKRVFGIATPSAEGGGILSRHD